MTDPLCTAAKKCWEHYEGNVLRVSERAIQLAVDHLTLRARALMLIPVEDELWRVRDAVTLVLDMRKRQWCEMVRKPFDFPVVVRITSHRPAVRKSVDDLLSDL